MTKIALSLAVFCGLSGCSLDPASFVYIPTKSTISRSDALSDAPDASTIVVRREPALGGFTTDYVFQIDGQAVVTLGSGEEAALTVRPGQYTFTSYCQAPLFDTRNDTLAVVLPRQAYIARMYADSNSTCLIQVSKAPARR